MTILLQILKITKADQTHFLVSFRLEEGLLTFYMQNNDLRTFMITGLNFKFSIKKAISSGTFVNLNRS